MGDVDDLVDGPASHPRAQNPNDNNPGFVADELRAFIERVERLTEEKAGIAGDIKDVFAELKGRGFDAKAVRSILRMRRKDQAERQEEQAILDLYMSALGMS